MKNVGKISALSLKSIQKKQEMSECVHIYDYIESLGYDSNDIEARLHKCKKCGKEDIVIDIDGFLNRSKDYLDGLLEQKEKYNQQNVIDNLLKGITFRFDFLVDGIAEYTSCTLVEVYGDLYSIKIELFVKEGDFLSANQTYEDIIERFDIFEVSYPKTHAEKKIIFHKKYNDYETNK